MCKSEIAVFLGDGQSLVSSAMCTREKMQGKSEIHLADEMEQQHMREMVDARRVSDKKVERHDLFHNLLDAADAEQDSLTDDEVFGWSYTRRSEVMIEVFHQEICLSSFWPVMRSEIIMLFSTFNPHLPLDYSAYARVRSRSPRSVSRC